MKIPAENKKTFQVIKDIMSLTGAIGPGEKVQKNYLKEKIGKIWVAV